MKIKAKSMTMEERREKLSYLIENFKDNYKYYKTQDFDESNTRLRFIDPFFECLGWDIKNEKGARPDKCEVITEDRVIIKGETKFPDYVFCYGGERKFFVEAKKPSVDIKNHPEPARQVRRYAYTAKLPISILTDFEELCIYDTRIKPDKDDDPSKARIFYCKYDDYLENFDRLYKWISWDAIDLGSFDTYTEEVKDKKGTTQVDDDILNMIDDWRKVLAEDIAKHNEIDVFNLNTAVQKIIDRIIFLRIAEDKQIEDYGKLKGILEKKDDRTSLYERLYVLFEKANDVYNAGLFATDSWLNDLHIEDKTLLNIILHLYYPECPYEFSVLPIEILGSIYEKFLGKVIHFTRKTKSGHSIEIEEKPEVQKAGGVYYTPRYIVKYIVENTIGSKIINKTPTDVSKFHFVDPACGSGSFLVGAYQYLLDWHMDYYYQEKNRKKAEKENKIYYDDAAKHYKLTIEEKKQILLNNIYGVDIDPQAVEVTRLSLYLKLLEDEGKRLANNHGQVNLFRDSDFKILPKLNDNIKCGNSLIEKDYYKDKDLLLFGIDDQRKINVFNWKDEFESIFKSGGFDCVIGNPPYLRIQGLQENFDNQIDYYTNKYHSAIKRFDIYLLFMEKGFTLLKESGLLGYICPHKFLNSDFGSGIRDFLIQNTAVNRIISFGQNMVFEKASTYTGLFFLMKGKNEYFKYFEYTKEYKNIAEKLFNLENEDYTNYETKHFSKNVWVLTSSGSKNILKKIQMNVTIKDLFKNIMVGVQSGIDEIHILKYIKNVDKNLIKLFSDKLQQEIIIERNIVKPLLMGDSVKRFQEPVADYYVIYPYKNINERTTILEEKEFADLSPHGYRYLLEFKKELLETRKRQKTNTKYWYSCHRSRDMNIFEQERIITPYASLGCNMTICPPGLYHNTKVYSLIPNENRLEHEYYWLALFNSNIMWYFMKNTGYVLRGGYYAFTTDYLNPFPVKIIDFSKKDEKRDHDLLVSLVEQMLKAKKNSNIVKSEADIKMHEKNIGIINDQIEALIYKLYELDEEDIEIIERK